MLMKETTLNPNDLGLLNMEVNEKAELLKIPNYVLSTRESRALYKHIKAALKNFNRNFDNTVVDTYAFNKVLTSEKLVNVIYFYLINKEDATIDIQYKITSYILAEVEIIYKKNKHMIFKPHVYLEYVNQLLKELT